MAKRKTSTKKAASKTAARMKTKTAKTAKKRAAAKKVLPIPRGYHAVTPFLTCRGAADAIEFYKRAFGAKEKVRMTGPDGSIMHAEIQIGDSVVMLGEESVAMGSPSPKTIGGTASGLFIYTKNVDHAYAKAIATGATPEMPPMDMFWGDRYCKFTDPFGHKWSMATHIEDVPMKQMIKRGQAEMAKMAASTQK